MKNILMACGSGVCTSTILRTKISAALDDAGFKNQYKITQCKIAEVAAMSANYDFCVATTMAPKEIKCPFVMGVCFLTGVGIDKAIEEIVSLMKK